ncbi:helix-turn-helix transcriptional regulator [Amycolatopsis sp. BJA-103]|uniref:helix-turn-helix domain-containing protein n=1 Tax=Amycolatopsis sp. BJA-103 TaxID=1911175 RepID=UPI000C9B6164|nr:helix-turn-helix transcriptional regulator [Amycolatopsis sp. BJA-103]PNE13093.1 hypothetical protein B1H26_42430 [Amycolatopsis sp. BJA-103]
MVRTNDVAAVDPRARTLAGLLRAKLDRAKADDPRMTIRAIAERLGVNHSTVSRWASGATSPDAEQVSGLLAVIGVVGKEREEILELARTETRGRTWVTPGPTGVSHQLTGVMEMEANATGMFEWSPLVVPGLIQDRRYARAIISKPKSEPSTVEHLVTLRLGRQHAITRDDPLKYTVVLGHPAIEGNIGGPGVMLGQLRHLRKVAEMGSVTLRLAPLDGDWHGGLLGSFSLYHFNDGVPSIVALEHHRTGSFVDDPLDVADYKILAKELVNEIAYDEAESVDLIRREIARREKAS